MVAHMCRSWPESFSSYALFQLAFGVQRIVQKANKRPTSLFHSFVRRLLLALSPFCFLIFVPPRHFLVPIRWLLVAEDSPLSITSLSLCANSIKFALQRTHTHALPSLFSLIDRNRMVTITVYAYFEIEFILP